MAMKSLFQIKQSADSNKLHKDFKQNFACRLVNMSKLGFDNSSQEEIKEDPVCIGRFVSPIKDASLTLAKRNSVSNEGIDDILKLLREVFESIVWRDGDDDAWHAMYRKLLTLLIERRQDRVLAWLQANTQGFKGYQSEVQKLTLEAKTKLAEMKSKLVVPDEDAYGTDVADRDRLAHIVHVSSAFGSLMSDLLVLRPALAYAVGAFAVGVVSHAMTDTGIVHSGALQHMDVSARISKWLVRLQEFEYTVKVESSTHASLVSMLTHRCYERKGKVKAPGPEPVEVQAKLSEAHSLYFDGAYKRKVDKASVDISIQDEDGQKVFGKGLLVENTHSNNEAEYAALALGLEWCVSMGIKRLNVFGDALLLIKQLYHVPRKENQEADALASAQLQEVIVGAIKLQNPLFQRSDCMHDIVNFLETGECPQDMSKGQRQWLVRKATKYRLINEHLYCKGKLYIIMGVDYMTRWAEATTSARITAKEEAKFVYESICCKFGVPLEILSDRGPGFRGDLVVSKPKDWDKHLSAALWAYRASFRTSLGYTPYHLVFGKEAIIPIEVQLASLKILATKNEGAPSDQLKQRILDLERLELDREMAIENYATQAERRWQKFNEGLKDKELKKGILVLRYDNRFDTRKDKQFMPKWEGPYVIRKKYTNGSYRLQDISGKLHKTRVNGWKLKPYFQRFDAEIVVNLPPKTSEEEEENEASSSQ
ncbi:hypothetical protein L7F22_018214 [Adiantum nelumboides]|nr:hypothetical protein [Adiantum nelumboides]